MTDQQSAKRAAAVAALDILDTGAEQTYDDIVHIAARMCDAPIALISLLDGERQWFKAKIGLSACETSLDASLCRIEIDRPALLQIADLTADPRTADNALVTGAEHLRFYAGVPLVTRDGVAVGRLCVIDTRPRPEGLTEAQQDLLGALGRQVSDHLELRKVAMASTRLAALQSALVAITDVIRASTAIEAMTAGAAAVVGRVLEIQRAGYGNVDEATETVEIEPDWTAPGVATIAGKHRFADFGDIREELAGGEPLVIDDVYADPRTAADPKPMEAVGIGALVNMPVRNFGATVAVFIIHSTRPRRWRPEELAFLRSVADRLEAGVARLRLEQQQDTINAEIGHRLKNMLAMVQAIASQTLRGIADRQPIEVFEQRLVALSGAHDVLLDRNWKTADLASIARGALRPFGCDDRVAVTGPAVELGPRAALSLALLVHELVTNALKYGALSRPDGRIALDWTIDAAGDEAGELRVRWRETGGPAVAAPTRRGFGSKLIRLGLVGTGGVEVRYPPAGFEADMRASVAHLLRS